jgi:hypothetical protein
MADNKNPFDLAGRGGGPARAHPARVWTPEEQAKKLAGYLEVRPEYWEQVRYGTHVRYYTKDGQFRTGGFVQKNPLDTKPHGAPEEKRFMKLHNGFNEKAPGYASWILAYEDAARIFIKPDAGTLQVIKDLETAVAGLNANIRKVAEYTKILETRIAALEHK